MEDLNAIPNATQVEVSATVGKIILIALPHKAMIGRLQSRYNKKI